MPGQAFDLVVELKSWQTVIGSALGFGALIAGALFNARLNRLRDDRLRKHEADAIMIALHSEIDLLRKELAFVANAVGSRGVDRWVRDPQFEEQFIRDQRLPDPFFYKALASDVGKIDQEVLKGVVQFYSNYEEAKTSLPLLIDRPGNKWSYGAAHFLHPAMDGVIDVEQALRSIEILTGVKAISEMPKLDGAESFIEVLEATYDAND